MVQKPQNNKSIHKMFYLIHQLVSKQTITTRNQSFFKNLFKSAIITMKLRNAELINIQNLITNCSLSNKKAIPFLWLKISCIIHF